MTNYSTNEVTELALALEIAMRCSTPGAMMNRYAYWCTYGVEWVELVVTANSAAATTTTRTVR